MVTLYSVSRIGKLTAVLMLALWLPATMHCQLEMLTGLKALACCLHEDAAPHQDNDCEQDSCAVVEAGLYPAIISVTKAPIPCLALVFLLPDLESFAVSAPNSVDLIGPAPLGLSQQWQFAWRTALPPRAPSTIS